jgi:hypothetical protein
VTLHNVTSSAAGQYAVQVDLSGGVQDPDIRTVNLVVSGRSLHYVEWLFESCFATYTSHITHLCKLNCHSDLALAVLHTGCEHKTCFGFQNACS